MPLPVLFRSGRRLRARIGALAAVPFAIAAMVSAIYYANLHRTAAAMAASSMAAFPGPAPGDRILIVAPHCDDETLGAGGLIETARRRGVPVKVVFLTHGDGFRIAASLALREVSPGPTDYLRFGEHRRSEAIAALTRLGVSPADIHFLGYPDQGLKMVWDTTSSPDTAFRSRFTETTRVPYPSAYRPDAPHTAESIVTDVSQIVADFRPTDVFTTHPSDDHGDHCAAAALVQASLLRSLQASKDPVDLHFFLIHRGDWPLPQGDHPGESIKPPAAFSALGPTWRTFTLDETARQAKRAALFEYRSQMDVMPRLLKSFLRRNEIFVTVDPSNPEPFTNQPVADDIARYAQPAADISSLRWDFGSEHVRVEAQMRGRSSPGIRYLIRARAMVSDGSLTGPVTRTVSVPLTASRSSRIDFNIPYRDLGLGGVPRAIWLGIEAGMNDRLPVDRTGYQCVVPASEPSDR